MAELSVLWIGAERSKSVSVCAVPAFGLLCFRVCSSILSQWGGSDETAQNQKLTTDVSREEIRLREFYSLFQIREDASQRIDFDAT